MKPAPLFIANSARILGNVKLGKDVSVWFNAVIRTETGKVIIGDFSNIQDNCIIHADYELDIGNNVTIGHGAIIHCSSIGNNTLIGMGAILLDGAKIGNNCIIAAGALVKENEEIPDNSLVMGVRGKIKREVTKEEIEYVMENACKYVKLGKDYAYGKYGK